MSGTNDSSFLWLGGNAAIDLVNTEIISRGKRKDLLQSEHDLALWWENAQLNHPGIEPVDGTRDLDCDSKLVELVKELRCKLRNLLEDIAEGKEPHAESIVYLNRTLERGYPILVWDSDQPRRSYRYHNDPYAPLLLPIALSALNLITQHDLERLHRCHNNKCILLFYDTTKNGNRQWCSTACMDRERSARRYREMKAKAKD